MTGKELRRLRKRNKLNQKQLGIMLGKCERTISRWETGKDDINNLTSEILNILLNRGK